LRDFLQWGVEEFKHNVNTVKEKKKLFRFKKPSEQATETPSHEEW
jgi:hypothetical protein